MQKEKIAFPHLQFLTRRTSFVMSKKMMRKRIPHATFSCQPQGYLYIILYTTPVCKKNKQGNIHQSFKIHSESLFHILVMRDSLGLGICV